MPSNQKSPYIAESETIAHFQSEVQIEKMSAIQAKLELSISKNIALLSH
jgi:hypothetical protein